MIRSISIVDLDGGEYLVNADGYPCVPVTAEQALQAMAKWLGTTSQRRPVQPGFVRIETAVGVHEFPAVQVAPSASQQTAPLDGAADCGHDVAG